MSSVPRHVGFIVDGNRRWAAARGRKPHEGHQAGYDALKDVLLETIEHGVYYASAYVFSTENWKRSEDEVNRLMTLLLRVLNDDLHIFIERNVRIRILGTRERLSKKVCTAIDRAEAATADLTSGQALLCLNYGGHQEVVDAVNACVQTEKGMITAAMIEKHLYAPDVPPCDLIVRTSGEQRLSNFMLWRSAYSELLFLEKHWPDMTKNDVTAILEEYARRNRRFGG